MFKTPCTSNLIPETPLDADIVLDPPRPAMTDPVASRQGGSGDIFTPSAAYVSI